MAKYDISKTKKLKFARYGGLSSVNQEGYDCHTADFHGPPARRGFYAFLWPYIEVFLLGSDCTKAPWTIGAKFVYVRDNDGNVIDEKHPDYSKYEGKDKYWSTTTKEYREFNKTKPPDEEVSYEQLNEWRETFEVLYPSAARYALVEKPHPRIFTYDGNLWHHLSANIRSHQVIKTKGDWVYSSMLDYRGALEKEMHIAHKNVMAWSFAGKNKILPTNQSALRKQCRDHLEIFIEKF